MCFCQLFSCRKALNGIQWEVADPLTLNNGAPIISVNATMCVSTECTYEVPSSLTHMIASTEMIWALLFNVNGWATSHWIH